MVSVPMGKGRAWGCLRPCLKCLECGGDGTCHWGVLLWASPSQDDLNRSWDPWVWRDSYIPTCLCSYRALWRRACSFGMPLLHSDPRETNRLLGRESVKNKIKGRLQIANCSKAEDGPLREHSFSERQLLFIACLAWLMAKTFDIQLWLSGRWGEGSQRHFKQIASNVKLGRGSIWGNW